MTHLQQAEAWLAAFDAALQKRDAAAAAALFGDEAYWRDIVAFTWNIRTFESHAQIAAVLTATLAAAAPAHWRIESASAAPGDLVEAWLRFETAAGRGRAIVRLKDGKAFTLLTALEELKGFEERKGRTRPVGLQHGLYGRMPVWSETRAAEQAALGHTEQPYCVIVGGGQGGIALGARLKQLGVPTIILETNARAGDSWRKRYRSLVLHDPVWYDHLPYIPFPDNWPVFTPKDKLGDWLEMYVRVMELDYWAHAESPRAPRMTKLPRHGASKSSATGGGSKLRPQQLVFATGAYGPPNEPDLAGRLGVLRRNPAFEPAIRPAATTRARAASSSARKFLAHDVAADLWDFGAEVTMLQRSPTCVVKSETLHGNRPSARSIPKRRSKTASRPRRPISSSPRLPSR